MSEADVVLEVDNLEKIFISKSFFCRKNEKKFVAVSKISFVLHKGEVLGLLGPNGAGKTTTIQMLLDTLTPTAGRILYFGKNFTTHRSEILQRVGFASAYSKLPGKLTIYENLDVFGRLYGLSGNELREKIHRLLALFGIVGLANKLTRTLSAGQMTRAILAKAFLADPDVVLLDEPTASLDPDIAHDIRQFIIQQQLERHISILFTSHNMDEVAEVCDRVLVLKNGNIVASDTPEQLAASISVARVELIINSGLDAAINYLQEHQLMYSLEKHALLIEVEEQCIAELLAGLAHEGVLYSQISIDKPSLEDYFIRIARQE